MGSFHDDIILRGLCYHFSIFKSFQSLVFSQNRNTSFKIDYGNFKLDLSRKLFDLQAVLSVTGCIGWIVFKWVGNTNSNVPSGGCFSEVLTSEQILKIGKSTCRIMTDNSSASPSLLLGMIFVN